MRCFPRSESLDLYDDRLASSRVHSISRHSIIQPSAFHSFVMYFFCLSLLALVTLGSSQQCPIVFDSRVAAGTSLASFDAATSVFGNSNVFGKGLAFSKLVVLPTVNSSLVCRNSKFADFADFSVRCKHHPRRSDDFRSIDFQWPDWIPPRRVTASWKYWD